MTKRPLDSVCFEKPVPIHRPKRAKHNKKMKPLLEVSVSFIQKGFISFFHNLHGFFVEYLFCSQDRQDIRLFNAADLDNSGDLTLTELRDLFQVAAHDGCSTG